MATRRLVLALLLAAAIGLSLQAVLWSPQDGAADTLEPRQSTFSARAATLHPGEPAVATDAAGATERREARRQLPPRPAPPRAPRDLFAAYSWSPPPPAAPAAAAPEAPPLPFTYAGRLEVDGRSTYLLLQGERTFRVPLGASVAEFTLTSAGPQGLVFLHRPTGLTQTLAAPGVPVSSE